MLNDRGPADLALRALRDCGVVRVRLGAVPTGYRQLQAAGHLSARGKPIEAGGTGYALCRLSPSGEQLARQLKPWSETK
jgi:hypothetical protein